MDVQQQTDYMYDYLDACAQFGKPTARLSPNMVGLIEAKPEVLEEYRVTRDVCGRPSGEPTRVFLCIGANEGHDELGCPPVELDEMKAHQQLSLDI